MVTAIACDMAPSKRRRILLWESSSTKKSEVEEWSSAHRQHHPLLLLPPPCTYERLYSSYGQEWEERRKKIPRNVEISDLASAAAASFTTTSTGAGSSWLAACTSLGEVLLWRANSTSSTSSTTAASSSEDGQSLLLLEQTPVQRWKVSNLPLKSLRMWLLEDGTTVKILVGGDEGLFSISFFSDGDDSSTAMKISKWKSVEYAVQQVLVDEEGDRVYLLGAAVDGAKMNTTVQVYSLSTEKLLQSIGLGGSNTSTMALTKHDDAVDGGVEPGTQHPLTLLIGTTDSQIVIWNEKDGGTMETIRLYDPDGDDSSKLMMIPFDITVTSICCSQGQWWTIAGASHHENNKHSSKSSRNTHSSNNNNNNNNNNNSTTGNSTGGGGILATLHGPTRTVVSCTETRETIRSIAISDDHGGATVYTAANEGVVTVWESPYRLERQVRIWTNPPSGHAITSFPLGTGSTTSYTSTVAISGVGPQVDILQDSCRIQTLDTK